MPANKVVALSQCTIWEIDCGVGLALVASYERCNHHLVQVYGTAWHDDKAKDV